MGIRWRRLNERVSSKVRSAQRSVTAQVKQKLHLANTSFLATSNRRCEMMFEEASQFAVHLRRMEANMRKLQDDAEGTCLWLCPSLKWNFRNDGGYSKRDALFVAVYV